jgi:hypothetical protein
MWRQGDVLMARIASIPPEAKRLPHLVVAEGERTGHCHQIKDSDSAALFEADGMLYLDVISNEATIVHEEHGPIKLGRATYRVWMQREYLPRGSRRLMD